MSWETIEKLSAALLGRAPHGEVLRLVEEVIDGIGATRHIHQATWHPSGFAVIPLNERNDHMLARIHIWPTPAPPRPNPDWPIHNHTWAIDSRILCGALTDETIAVTSDPEGAHVLYLPACAADGTGMLVRSEARVSATVTRRSTYHAGEQYYLAPDAFHVSVPAPDLTATVVVMTRPSFGATRVLGDLSGADSYHTSRPPVAPDVALILLGLLRTAMRRPAEAMALS
ncbi:MAG TPA: hypothetical protein VFS21_28110 [Roseiflexaceae bacterium]|nr:hypothetical protein [Roseiflexaceae bacterium]